MAYLTILEGDIGLSELVRLFHPPNLFQIQNLGSWATHFQVRIKLIFQVLSIFVIATTTSEPKAELQRHIWSKRHSFYSTIFLRTMISRDFSSNWFFDCCCFDYWRNSAKVIKKLNFSYYANLICVTLKRTTIKALLFDFNAHNKYCCYFVFKKNKNKLIFEIFVQTSEPPKNDVTKTRETTKRFIICKIF